MLDADSLENTVLEKRIKDIASHEFVDHPVYKLGKRSRTNNVIIRTSLGSINSQKTEPSPQKVTESPSKSNLKKPTIFTETPVSPQKLTDSPSKSSLKQPTIFSETLASPQKVSDNPSKAFTPNKLSGLMGEALVAKAGLDVALNKSAKMYSPA